MHTRLHGVLTVWLAIGIVGFVPSAGVASQPSQEQLALERRPGQWVSDSSVSASRGKYGTGQTTTVTQLSQAVTYQGQVGEVGLTVPYLFRHGGGVTAGETTRAKGQAVPEDAHGLGDLQVKGAYYWLEETPGRPGLDLTGRVKVPTASEDKGLGTGRVDVGVGPELWKRFGSLVTFTALEVVFRDRPSGSSIKTTRLDYSVGVGYPLASRFTAYASLDGGTSSSAGAEAPLEFVLSGVYKITEMASIHGFLLAGLSDGSPDVGGGTGVTLRF